MTHNVSQSITELLGEASINALFTDTTHAKGLPGKAYGEDFYAIEQRELFPKVWCVAGVASDLPNKGDMRPVDIAGWPVLLLRDGAGDLKAFYKRVPASSHASGNRALQSAGNCLPLACMALRSRRRAVAHSSDRG